MAIRRKFTKKLKTELQFDVFLNEVKSAHLVYTDILVPAVVQIFSPKEDHNYTICSTIYM